MSNTNQEWSITQVFAPTSQNGDANYAYAVRVGDNKYVPGYCAYCEDTMVDVDTAGKWADGDCAKCGRYATLSYSSAATKQELMRNVAIAMFPDPEAMGEIASLNAMSCINSVVRGTPPLKEEPTARISFSLKPTQLKQLLEGCRDSDTTIDEIVVGALIQMKLVQQ